MKREKGQTDLDGAMVRVFVHKLLIEPLAKRIAELLIEEQYAHEIWQVRPNEHGRGGLPWAQVAQDLDAKNRALQQRIKELETEAAAPRPEPCLFNGPTSTAENEETEQMTNEPSPPPEKEPSMTPRQEQDPPSPRPQPRCVNCTYWKYAYGRDIKICRKTGGPKERNTTAAGDSCDAHQFWTEK